VNGWVGLATVMFAGVGACGLLAALREPPDGLVALELASVLGTLALLALAEGFHREPFGDLAVISALVSLTGNLAFARFLERGL
jgi:multisubunit Na+/H+ antiporter MnhF subunit